MSSTNREKNDRFQMTSLWILATIWAMDFATFASVYQNKTDEELLDLIAQAEHLTAEAKVALTTEVAKRRLEFTPGIDTRAAEETRQVNNSGPDQGATHAAGVSDFIAQTLGLYAKHRWLFIELMFPAVLISYMAATLTRYEMQQITRDFLTRKTSDITGLILVEVQILSGLRWLIGWFASCVGFAAICVAVTRIEKKSEDRSVKALYQQIRSRLGALFKVSFLLLVLFVFLEIVLGAGPNIIFWRILARLRALSSLAYFVVTYLLISLPPLILSRFALSIPAVVLDNNPAGQALFRSDELTEGRWPVLAALLFKSVAGGYIAAMLPYWITGLLTGNIALPTSVNYLLALISMAAVTVVEPIMFIGFALLYLNTSGRSAAQTAQAASA